MTTPALSFTGEMCLDFFYHMRGVDIGTLTVYLQAGSVFTSAARSVFSRSGEQGGESEAWLNARLTIQTTSNQDRVLTLQRTYCIYVRECTLCRYFM